uniref:Uncharacterized protein n=1 Tax=viral metagenome TaxID=1070528 RepID=A0A6C0II60_9ZZZZ
MAINRCFDTFIPVTNASDYLNTTRQKTLFNEVNNNVNRFNTANPKKLNGSTYNKNFSVSQTNNVEGVKGCLVFANNYQLLLDITKGETIVTNQNISCDGNTNERMNAPVFDAWSGNLYSVNYAQHDVGNILQYDQTNCIYDVDPDHLLFYNSCPLTDLTDYPPEWFNVVDISFNNTAYYIEANRAQILNGFNYPEKVIFGNNL